MWKKLMRTINLQQMSIMAQKKDKVTRLFDQLHIKMQKYLVFLGGFHL